MENTCQRFREAQYAIDLLLTDDALLDELAQHLVGVAVSILTEEGLPLGLRLLLVNAALLVLLTFAKHVKDWGHCSSPPVVRAAGLAEAAAA